MKPTKRKTLRPIQQVQGRQAHGKKPTLLIIEDEQFLCRLLVKKFESSGFVVQKALDGETGLKIAERELPDVILLDLLLPGLDGFEVLRRLNSNAALQGIPVIVISNLSEATDIDKAKQMGVAEYLIKAQNSPQQILDKVKELIG